MHVHLIQILCLKIPQHETRDALSLEGEITGVKTEYVTNLVVPERCWKKKNVIREEIWRFRDVKRRRLENKKQTDKEKL